MKIRYVISFLLILCCILSGCGNNGNDKQSELESSQTITASPIFPSQRMLVGQWEGTGYFDSLARRGIECKYILNFFEDGSMSLSSDNLYFYGYNVDNVSIRDGLVDFSFSYFSPTLGERLIPLEYRNALKISMSLQIGEEALIGTAKQGDWSFRITFNKTSEQPRSYEETEQLSSQQMAEDCEIVFDILENKHPDAFYTQSQEEYEKKKAELITKLPTLDKEGFYYELRQFVASIGDAHTAIDVSKSTKDNIMLLPMDIDYLSDKWYITAIDKQYEGILGREITAINDIPMDEVLAKVSTMIGYENKAGLLNRFPDTVTNADLLEHLEIVKDRQAIITVDNKDRVVVSAVKSSELAKNNFIKMGVLSDTSYQPNVNYMYQSLDEDIFYIQYNACVESVDYPISKFGEEINYGLSAKKYKKIVIDLRYNSGGNSALIEKFIKPVLAATDNGAQLYCLIGGKTFSSAFTNAIMLDKEGAILVGQPTGGNMQQFTEINPFELSNSRFSGRYSTKFTNYDENAPYDSLYPDKQIKHTIDAYKNGIDEDVEYIKNNE